MISRCGLAPPIVAKHGVAVKFVALLRVFLRFSHKVTNGA